jgi:sugar phosphate isomerase/epimerase
MKVGIHAGGNDLDETAAHCLPLDVSDVFVSADSVSGFAENGHLRTEAVEAMRDGLAERGVHVAGMIAPVPSKETVLGQDEYELVNLCKTLDAIGKAGVDTVLFYPLDRFIHFHEFHPGRPLTIMPGDNGWEAIIDFFRRVVDVADETNLNLANHLWTVDVLHAIWGAAPSPHNGVTYCQGMYIFGEEPDRPIDTWGFDRIFFAHARNLIRHGPAFQDYEEVALDKGDVDMARCVRALTEAGYDGVIVPEHLGEGADLANAVKYLRRIIDD